MVSILRTSLIQEDNASNSASVVDVVVADFTLDDHTIGPSLKDSNCPLRDLLVALSCAQSASV